MRRPYGHGVRLLSGYGSLLMPWFQSMRAKMKTMTAPVDEALTAMQRIAAVELENKKLAGFVGVLSLRLVEAMDLIAGLSLNQRIFVAILDAQQDTMPGEAAKARTSQKAH
jgi:hypothetical protein